VSEFGGSSILITGQNFLNVETLVCEFNDEDTGIIATVDAFYLSSTTMRCTVPVGTFKPTTNLKLSVGNSIK